MTWTQVGSVKQNELPTFPCAGHRGKDMYGKGPGGHDSSAQGSDPDIELSDASNRSPEHLRPSSSTSLPPFTPRPSSSTAVCDSALWDAATTAIELQSAKAALHETVLAQVYAMPK